LTDLTRRERKKVKERRHNISANIQEREREKNKVSNIDEKRKKINIDVT